MGKHYSGSPAPSSMTHGSGPCGSDAASRLIGAGPGAAAKRVKPSQAENPSDPQRPASKRARPERKGEE